MTRVKTGGRQAGTKNRVTDSMRRDILSVYRKLGGPKFLLSWAKENGTEYVKQCLSRVMPPMPRQALEDEEFSLPAESSMFETARRIAFILAQADAMSPRPLDVEMVELSPASQAPEPQDPPLPPLDEAPTMEPCATPRSYPRGDPEGVAETYSETLKTFRGTVPAEQGRSHARPDVIDRRGQAHEKYLARLASKHRRSLI